MLGASLLSIETFLEELERRNSCVHTRMVGNGQIFFYGTFDGTISLSELPFNFSFRKFGGARKSQKIDYFIGESYKAYLHKVWEYPCLTS